ncbi:MAG TPA: glycerol-3-phosphate acyltransferase [Ktedonobacterales bacterium]
MTGTWIILLWVAATYLLGAIPWSVWLGQLFFRVDPRAQRDGNPGAANSFRTAGWRLGVAVLALDFFKAFIPVAAARWLVQVPGAGLFWIALMPTLGHAFSIFLRFRGGRGIVVMFGVWAGLTLYVAPLALGAAAIAGVLLLKNDELRALAIPIVLIAFLLVTHAPLWMLLVALAQLLVLAAKIGVYLMTRREQIHGGV